MTRIRRAAHVCPWWLAYTFDNPIRRLVHRPERIIGPYLASGMTVLDVGCGMGYFSLAMAGMVGPGGRVVAADIQPVMLELTMRRLRRAGLADRVRPHLAAPDDLGNTGEADFTLAFWSLHEAPEPLGLARQIAERLKTGGRFLLVEPWGHVSSKDFRGLVAGIAGLGLEKGSEPAVYLSRAAVFVKP